MKYISPVFSEARGSTGGVVYSRNRGGNYTRSKIVPVNPSTSLQNSVRAILTSLTAAWSTLTALQRTAWSQYALDNPITNSLGLQRNAGGLAMFIRANANRIRAGEARIDTAPATNGPATLTAPVVTTVDVSSANIQFTFTNTDAWAASAAGSLLVFVSRGFPPTINRSQGLQFMGTIAGAVSPPTSPGTVAVTTAFSAGQRVFYRFIAVGPDGRVSGSVDGSFLAVA